MAKYFFTKKSTQISVKAKRKEVNYLKEFHYKCPQEKTCAAKKHCHVLKTAEELKITITAIVKCPVQKKEIVVEIGQAIA